MRYGYLKDHLRELLGAAKAMGATIRSSGFYASQEIKYEPELNEDAFKKEGPLCLLGTVEALTGQRRYEALGLSCSELSSLEAGFCHWPGETRDKTLYDLGRKLADEFAEHF